MKAIKYFSCILLIAFQSISAQNFWHQTNGPYGVPTVYDFLQYDDSTIFLGTSEGIIRSQDNGESWTRIEGQYLNSQIKCISQDNFGVLYAGSLGIYPSGLKKLFKSTNQGNTWNILNGPYAEIRYIFIPYKDTILLGSWDMGVIRTFDGGVTWSIVNNGNIYNGIHEIIQLDDGSVLAGSAGGGVLKTTNWGDLWIPSNTGIPADPQGYRFAKSFCKTAPDCLLVGTAMGIYYSTNSGETWSFKSAGLTNKEINRIVKDENGTLYAGTDMGNGVYYSTNGGDYWYHLGLGLTTYTLGWDSESRLYAGGLSSGLYRFVTADSTWTQIYNQGYNPVEVDDLCLTRSGYLLAITHWDGLYYTTNNGEHWIRTNYQGNDPYAIETINDSVFITGVDDIKVSNDFGITWSITADFGMYNTFHYDSLDNILYAGSNSIYNGICGIYTSNTFGYDWELLYSFPMIAFYQWIKALYVTKTNHIILTFVIYSWPYNGNWKFFRSTDQGQTWEIIIEGHLIYQIIEDASLNVYALASNGLMISEDEGETWILRNRPSDEFIATDYSGRIYCGLSYTTDKGETWLPMPISGLQGGAYDMVINQNNRIYICNSQGVFYAEADSLVVSVENIEPVQTFLLFQNYPNPFNPNTVISYQLPVSGVVTLKVYDILGNEIATLVNEEKQPGSYEVEFNTTSIKYLPSSGVYFYQLKASNFVETKKMLLLK